ncbi:hypothetical protein [Halovenus marina]|uniref:hypothetical protein n=1 Tax=Halovenus marina TaxID=3396621 RepID=UPI003F54975D
MSGLFVLFVAVALLVPLLLYWFTEQEITDPTVVNRSEAEQMARERGGRPGARPDGTDDSDDEWGADSEWGHDEPRR